MNQISFNSLAQNSSTLKVQLELRDYQQDLANKIESHWNAGIFGVLAQSPTGSGKRVIFTYLASKALEIGESILVIVPKIELLNQATADLERFSGISVGIIKIKSNPFSRIQVATIQSLTKRKLPKAEVVATMDRLFELVSDRGYQKSWVFFKLVKEHPDVGFAELRELAKKLGYQPGWAYYKHLELRALAGGEK